MYQWIGNDELCEVTGRDEFRMGSTGSGEVARLPTGLSVAALKVDYVCVCVCVCVCV